MHKSPPLTPASSPGNVPPEAQKDTLKWQKLHTWWIIVVKRNVQMFSSIHSSDNCSGTGDIFAGIAQAQLKTIRTINAELTCVKTKQN